MAEIAGFAGMSHSPFATLLPPPADGGPGAKFLADAARVRRAVEVLAPDAIVVLGPDHFHGNFYDVMPPFVLGVEHAVGFGDFGSTEGPLPVAGPLAWSVHNGLTDAGFDVSLSYSLTVDHGIVQTYEMITGGTSLPMVPLVVNTAAPPLPTLQRCVALGTRAGRGPACGGLPRPRPGGGERRAVALAAVERPPRPGGGGGAPRVPDPRPRGRPRLRGGPRTPRPRDGRRPGRPREHRLGQLVPHPPGRGRHRGGDAARPRGAGGVRGHAAGTRCAAG